MKMKDTTKKPEKIFQKRDKNSEDVSSIARSAKKAKTKRKEF